MFLQQLCLGFGFGIACLGQCCDGLRLLCQLCLRRFVRRFVRRLCIGQRFAVLG